MITYPRTDDEDTNRALDAIAAQASALAAATGVISGSFTFTPAAVPATSSATYTIAAAGGDVAVSGLRPGQPVYVAWPGAPPPGVMLDCWCDAADTLKVRFQNFTGAALTPPAGAYAFYGTPKK